MKGIKGIKTLSALLAIVFSMALCTTSTAFGADEQPCSVRINFELEDVKFDLYRVGNVSDSGQASLVDELSDYKVDLYDENAAYTLSLYLRRDVVAPLKTSFTDNKGVALFDDLDKGVYLILGTDVTVGNSKYSFLPVMLSLPMKDGDTLKYDVDVQSKFEKKPVEDAPVDVSVVKIWKNSSDKSHPAITVQLLRDYEVYETVTLSDENSWKYSWKGLDGKYEWSIAEVMPGIDCVVDIRNDSYLFTLTNTFVIPDVSSVPETTTPVEEASTALTSPTKPDTTTPKPTVPRTTIPKSSNTVETKGRVTNNVSSSSSGTIPQTGQLNWPVPVLVSAGIIFIAVGIVLARKKSYE